MKFLVVVEETLVSYHNVEASTPEEAEKLAEENARKLRAQSKRKISDYGGFKVSSCHELDKLG